MLGLFLIHGSRDPRPQAAAQTLVQALIAHRADPPLHPQVATLELGELTLAQQVVTLAHQAQAQGHGHLHLLPLFLLRGNHVGRDIPAALAEAHPQLPHGFRVSVAPPLGQDPALVAWLRSRRSVPYASVPCASVPYASVPGASGTPPTLWILLAHGSQRPQAQTQLNALAQGLEMTLATFATDPSLATQVQRGIDQGCSQVGILPFFLFAGSITDAIAVQVEELQAQYPHLGWQVLPPLAQQPGFTTVLGQWLDRSWPQD
ncbi:sirohydrochlorin chelatase [Prochlorothrix hollandica]|uniref:sirohydrochlorin chelatase n=1 Tax=Prochlorothrix hollandica TaxID=1223 RepID=UPI003340FBED